MHVEIQHYRCIERVKFGLGGPLTLLVGPNGAGKTSYLEALFLGVSKGLATPIGKPTLAWVVIGRGEPYSPSLVSTSAEKAVVEIDGERTVITNKSCMKELDEAIDKEKQVLGLGRFLLYLAQLAGYPIPEYALRELGRVYACSDRGASAVAVYPNDLITAFSGGETDALYISPHLARSIRYVSPLIDVATERSPDCVAEVLSLLKIRDVRNIAGLPHVILKEGKAMRISDVASGVAYAAVLGLSMCAANRVYVDEPEAHLHPGMIETLGLIIEKMIKERKIEVAVATQSIEVLDVFTHLDVDGSVLRLKNCSLHDQMTLKEARERIDSLHDDLRYY